ncbi:MAG TPA: hypothetical protein VGH22_21215 [Candidatus Binatia bacterium]|jgi:hypothetical protein
MSEKFIVEMSADAYLICLAKFPPQSAEYILLKEASIIRNADGAMLCQFVCNAQQLALIKALAAGLCPEVLKTLRQTSLDEL